MLELGREIGRQNAHDVVYEASQASFLESRPFSETLAEVEEVSSRLSPERIAELLDPTRYTGVCSVFAERGAKQAREVAGSLA